METLTERRKPSELFLRFISVESTRSVDVYNKNGNGPSFNFDFLSVEFIIKLFQLLISIICGGCFSKGLLLIQLGNNALMLTFCNMTISSCIIITSVIILSYILGYIMRDFPMRLYHFFNSLFYLITACLIINFLMYFDIKNYKYFSLSSILQQYDILVVVAVLSFVNSGLYAFDIFWNMRNAYKSLNN